MIQELPNFVYLVFNIEQVHPVTVEVGSLLVADFELI